MAKAVSNFRAYEWNDAGEKVDVTEKYLALSGKLKRACSSRKIQCPRPTPADKQYDVNRARGYFEAITGRTAGNAVWADERVNGEPRLRIRWVMDGKALWEIPHWDWNGHNQTIEDCQINETRDEVELLFA